MDRQELLEKLLSSYESAFDIKRSYRIDENVYDAYAQFRVTSAKYVLVKRAELWRADCFEHTLFACRDEISEEDITTFHTEIVSHIEPHLVRRDEKAPPKNHMYTYMTGIFISEKTLSEKTKKAVRGFKYLKNYRAGFRGYSQGRLVVFDLESRTITGNCAAKDLIKGYRKVF